MFACKTITCAFVILAAMADLVHGSAEECEQRYGPVPTGNVICDVYPNAGSYAHLNNQPTDKLNTEVNTETHSSLVKRMSGLMPTDDPDNFEPQYDPVDDAFCFNDDYPVPFLSSSQQNSLYMDYKNAFDEINDSTNDVSEENNRVTNNRIPGMFLRMCFHDNSVDPAQPDFQDYVTKSIDPITKKWIGESRYMRTSGADASHLICPEERYHPNNNYDQTASRVLRSIQKRLKSKYKHMSYADLLHNGCNAATIYLTSQNPSNYLAKNPFTFGRKDACHADKKCTKKYPLCGPTELLPGVTLTAPEVSRWFTSRGMSNCLFMALMWTHTTMDNMASLCPIKRLTCRASSLDVSLFTDRTRLYFKAGDNLDYFGFFLNRGSHVTLLFTGDDGDPSCNWNVNGTRVPWPMTAIDCTLGRRSVERSGPTDLANVIKSFGHNRTYSRVDILQCALNVLGGKGGLEGGACNLVVPQECKPASNHKFGGFYSTLPPSSKRRVTVDPRCEKYGYHRRTLTVTSPDSVVSNHVECLDAQYDMYLVIEGAHFAGLATPTSNYSSSNFCPPIVLHSKSEKNEPMEKLMVVASHYDVEQLDVETKHYLGSRPLVSIVNAFEAAKVGLNDGTMYNPITNNCVAMLRNMADPLDIRVNDERLIQFITSRLLSDSANHMFQIIQASPTLKTFYDGSNRLLKAIGSSSSIISKEEIVSKLIQLYM
jgi:Peroxidase